ncbi:MAG: DUF3367 domain-containing protein [Acidimicrobiales bacterium]|nr:DUF3367 domain-containing protein [Acidimicrobiales bacterium]MCB9373717.1 DUF3367 domain-containing protein [Microthrixaceae bacterium]
MIDRLGAWARRRAQPLVVSVLVVVGCLLQAPGRLVRDTKLDLVIDPVGFLARTLHLWDPSGSFGQLQNQAVGYLFPIGPFFAIGNALGVPGWILQRAWFAALLLVGLWGALRVLESLDVGRPGSRVLGATAYGLSPSILTLVGFQSGAELPHALLPWALLPLIVGARRGSPRRAAALSGLAIVAMGGVNAAATAAVLVLPALWLVTRAPGPRRRALLGWWSLAVVLATTWWGVGLVLQGRYGLAFADYTETASITTSTTSAVEALRGTSNWVGYLVVGGRPWLQGAWSLITLPAAVVATSLLTALGLGGLARRDLPERTFWVLSLGAAVTVLTVGYTGAFGGAVAGPARDLLDGPLAPFRNLHKFSPVVALPVAVGVAHASATLTSWARRSWERTGRRSPSWSRPLAAGLALALLGAAAFPVVSGRVATLGSFEDLPGYWRETADWLNANSDGERALVVPGASFGEYEWGRTFNEPLQPLVDQPWAVRDLIPLGSVGAVRLLDGVEELFTSGRSSPALAPYLARAGVRYVVARNDLDVRRVTASRPLVVRSVLAGSPGLERVAAFGPEVDPPGLTTRLVPGLDEANDETLRAVEIYEVAPDARRVTTYPTAGTRVVSGGPEALLPIEEALPLDGSATMLAGDERGELGPDDQWVLTDDLGRRDVNYGRVHTNASYVLTEDEPSPNTGRSPHDRLVVPGVEHQTTARNRGAAEIRASSYALGLARLPEAQPFAAFDGDPGTVWRPQRLGSAVGDWVELRLDEPVDVASIGVEIPPARVGRGRVARVLVTTDAGRRQANLAASAGANGIELPAGETRTIRLTITDVEGGTNALEGPGISEITIPGLELERPLVTPDDRPDALDGSGEPLIVLDRLRADPFDLTRHDEESGLHRVLRLPDAGTFTVSGTATPVPGLDLIRLVDSLGEPGAIDVQSTSTWGGLPAFSARRLLDGDPATSWVSDPSNPVPTVTLRWDEPRTLDEVRIVDTGPPTEQAARLRLESPAGDREVVIGGAGGGAFAPLTTDEVTVSFPTTVDPFANATRAVGLAELRFPALDDLRRPTLDPDAEVTRACGDGPEVSIDGRAVPTSLTGTVADLLEARPLTLETCAGPVRLDAGRHDVDAPADGQFAPARLVLRGDTAPAAPAGGRAVEERDWGATRRTVQVGAGDEAYLALAENFNDGWRATLDGTVLEPVRLDGWRQAWVVPAGAGGPVTLTFAPDRPYRAGLALGALFVVALVALAVVGPRRRRQPPPADGRTLSPLLVVAVALVAGVAIGGPLVLFVPLLLLLPGRDDSLPFLAGLAYLGAGVLVALNAGPGGNAFGAATQILAVEAVAAVLISLVPPTWPALPWLRARDGDGPPAAPTARTASAPDG